MEQNTKKPITRRDFLKVAGAAGAALTGLAACTGRNAGQGDTAQAAAGEPAGRMTYRTSPTTGDRVSLLGFGMMRLPSKKDSGADEGNDEIDQELVNQMVDHAMKHGVNYFDTSPAYCRGRSEAATGIALSRYPRKSYYVATKLSNFGNYSREASMEMYRQSFKELQVDYIDYYLLHSVGGGGMQNLHDRYLDNGMLDFLLEERRAGRIRTSAFRTTAT